MNENREREGRDDQLPCAACGELAIWVGRFVAPGGYSHMNAKLNANHRPEPAK